jgi:nicotinamide phosphoribosyltransferase
MENIMTYSNSNIILKTDSYKFSHPYIFPKGMHYMHNYLESRGGDNPATIFFGLQYILKEHFNRPVTVADVEEADDFCKKHGVPFYKEGWMYIATKLNGKLPIKIRAVPEGSLIPNHNVLMTIESTDPEVAWLPGHLETLLMQIWYPLTVATKSYYTRQLILSSLNKTADNPEQEIEFKHHSFGYRGVSSCESAGIGGAAELLFSRGTDTVAGILCAMDYYNAGVCGYSIPASEHSTIISYGKDHEEDAFRNMVDQFGKPGAIFACVSDSYDIYNACEHLWGEKLKDKVIKSGATVVVRPDSGNPLDVVSECLELLDSKFGSTINSKGYKVLNHVRLIQGDGIDYKAIGGILNKINYDGFSTTNIAFGQGGGSLQKVNRDTFRMAIKCSNVIIDGEDRNVFKKPVGDRNKASKSGRLDLVKKDNIRTIVLKPGETYHKDSLMRTVYENGDLLIEEDFETIRARANR